MGAQNQADICRAAVFDFDEPGCRELAETVRAWFAGDGTPVEVQTYTAIEPMVREFHARPWEMTFVAVEGMMAVEAARLLREEDANHPIFLVSAVGDFALEGFRIHALDYLVRPVSAARVGKAVARIREPVFRSMLEWQAWEKNA